MDSKFEPLITEDTGKIELATAASDGLIGQFIGQKYEVLEKVGEGGMGTIYKVMHGQLKRLFAMKVLTPGSSGFDRTRIERFDQEAKAASGLNHHNLVGIHDYGVTTEGVPYVVMEFVEGQTIDRFIANPGTFDDATALEIFIQLCDGIDYAHTKHIIHRDLKPSNIMLSTHDGKLIPRILDFGIAKVNDPDKEQGKVLTQTGELIGSPQYMSPEQCMGYRLDGRSDLYSLGCVMFEMLTGRKLFVGDSAMSVMFQHINERAPLFRTIDGAAKVRPELERVILQTLEKDPDNRYQNADDLRNDLLLIRSGKNPVKEVSQARQRLKNTLRVLQICGVALLVPLIAVGAFVTFNEVTKAPWQRSVEAAQNELTRGNNNNAELQFRKAFQQAKDSKQSAKVQESILVQLAKTAQFRKAPDALNYASQALALSYLHNEDFQRASILDAISQYYLDADDAKAGIPYAKYAVEVRKNTLPTTHISIATSLQRLGQVYRQASSLTEAEAVDREALKMAIQLYPKLDNAIVADLYEQLANVLADQKKLSESLTNAQKALEVSTAVRGIEHPYTEKIQRRIQELKEKQSNAATLPDSTKGTTVSPGKQSGTP